MEVARNATERPKYRNEDIADEVSVFIFPLMRDVFCSLFLFFFFLCFLRLNVCDKLSFDFLPH